MQELYLISLTNEYAQVSLDKYDRKKITIPVGWESMLFASIERGRERYGVSKSNHSMGQQEDKWATRGRTRGRDKEGSRFKAHSLTTFKSTTYTNDMV